MPGGENEEPIFQVLQTLQNSVYFPPNVLGPILLAGKYCNSQALRRYTELILKHLVTSLNHELLSSKFGSSSSSDEVQIVPDKETDERGKILIRLLPLIDKTALGPTFCTIIECLNKIPISFAIKLNDINPYTFLSVFSTDKARQKIFQLCPPLFEKIVITIIGPFSQDLVVLDSLIFSSYLEFTQTIDKPFSERLDAVHTRLCDECASKLDDLCKDSNELYQRVFVILSDIWAKTGNPLFAALQIELSNLRSKRGLRLDTIPKTVYDFICGISIRPLNYEFTRNDYIYVEDTLFKCKILNFVSQGIINNSAANKFPADDPILTTYIQFLLPNINNDDRLDLLNYFAAFAAVIKFDIEIEYENCISDIYKTIKRVNNQVFTYTALLIAFRMNEKTLVPVRDLIVKIFQDIDLVRSKDLFTGYVIMRSLVVNDNYDRSMLIFTWCDDVIKVLLSWCIDDPEFSTLFVLFLKEIESKNSFLFADKTKQYMTEYVDIMSNLHISFNQDSPMYTPYMELTSKYL
ncbi:hypothetical protein TVAG_174860 [Trichomonas vaginalis G3]|uniref:Uncharacterized protein n=1 Tax=Trichomonas vaginalis (strain ATCC PRA-98 / G3) TaxID=412133 RepID=A2EK32_TRIV3|nr:hypothetical protein TVAGG3_0974200 [Trichomonas vaginalis G3]EAY07016.1 hypothetical protein TVAG_174860 [Trichomonas vaginalis G3]KAI5488804.1 hypothetical protein TVAGG3_0974200 [Trichomonas vaginalis G3]|eukprot:XP_001319239.1 hypothetical protein [Trichomonas vaginalis G3]